MPFDHELTVFNAVDVPNEIATAVMRLLDPYNPDIYTRACNEKGQCPLPGEH